MYAMLKPGACIHNNDRPTASLRSVTNSFSLMENAWLPLVVS